MYVHPRALAVARAVAKVLPYFTVGVVAVGAALPAYAAAGAAGIPGMPAVMTAIQNGSVGIGVAGAVSGVALKSLHFHHEQRGDWSSTIQGLALSAGGGAIAGNAVAIAAIGGAGAVFLR